MKNSIITFVLFALIVLQSAFAQQMPFSSQYYSNQFITNPALTGNKTSTNVFLTHRSQYSGIAGGPQTSYFTVDGPLRSNKIGLGLTMYSDVTDILNRSGVNASYAYKLDFNGTGSHNLTFGLALGIVNNKINFSKVTVLDMGDPSLNSQEQSKTVINSDFGLAYHIGKLEVGAAIPQIIGNRVNYKNNLGATGTYNMARHYYGSLKYVFDVSTAKEITAYPLVMVRSVAGAPFQYDVNAVIDWKKYGWLGVTYHSNYAVAVSAGLRWKSLSIGYAYDLGISRIKSYAGTTQEFLLSYNIANKNNDDLLDKLKEDILILQKKDTVNTLEIEKLKDTDSIQKTEIDSLKLEIEKLKLISDSAQAILDSHPLTEKEKADADAAKKKADAEKDSLAKVLMEKELNNSGTRTETDSTSAYAGALESGFYIIIGTFSSLDNAQNFTKDAKKKGYKTAQIIQNKKSQLHQIVIFKTKNKDEALQKLEGIKTDYFDVWVLTLE